MTTPPPGAPRPTPSSPSSPSPFEQFVGGRGLALVGATMVLVGIGFFVASSVSAVDVPIPARFLGLAAFCAALAAAGVWLRGRAPALPFQAAAALVGTGAAGLYADLSVAGVGWDLVGSETMLGGLAAVSAATVAWALRTDSRTLAGLGSLGALATPAIALDTATASGAAASLLAMDVVVALAARRSWSFLAVGGAVLGLLPILDVVDAEALGDREEATALLAYLGLAAYGLFASRPIKTAWDVHPATVGVPAVAAAVAYAVDQALGIPAAIVVSGLATAGFVVLAAVAADRCGRGAGLTVGSAVAGVISLGALAEQGDALGATGRFAGRVGDQFGWTVRFVEWATAPSLFAALSFACLVVAALGQRRGSDGVLTVVSAASASIALATLGLFEGFGDWLVGDERIGYTGCALALIAQLALVGRSRLTRPLHLAAALVGGLVSAAVLTELTTPPFEAAVFVAVLAAFAAAYATAVASSARFLPVGSVVYLGLAVLLGLLWAAPTEMLSDPTQSVVPAVLAALAVGAAALAVARTDRRHPDLALALCALAGLAVVYGGGIGIVGLFPGHAAASETGLPDLGPRSAGQVGLSLWIAAVGAALVLAGLSRRLFGHVAGRGLRVGGLICLLGAATKIGLIDLDRLDASWRVASFTVAGLVLIGVALAWQVRMRETNAG